MSSPASQPPLVTLACQVSQGRLSEVGLQKLDILAIAEKVTKMAMIGFNIRCCVGQHLPDVNSQQGYVNV